jgi:hypothetical protein
VDTPFGNLAVLAFLVAQALDGALTYVGVATWGPAVEGNPLVVWLMHSVGAVPGLAGAKAVAGTCGIALHLSAVHNMVAALTGLYVLVAILPWTAVLFF